MGCKRLPEATPTFCNEEETWLGSLPRFIAISGQRLHAQYLEKPTATPERLEKGAAISFLYPFPHWPTSPMTVAKKKVNRFI